MNVFRKKKKKKIITTCRQRICIFSNKYGIWFRLISVLKQIWKNCDVYFKTRLESNIHATILDVETVNVEPIDRHKFHSFHLISTQSLSGYYRWRCNNTFSHFHVFLCPQGISTLHSCPFFDVIFPSLLLFSSPSCSFHCPLQNCHRHSRWSWDVAIPSEFPFLQYG